jgi:carboxymethylenebutenolidase
MTDSSGKGMMRLAGAGRTLDAYRALPSRRPAPLVLVVHEIFGLAPHIRDVCDRFASEGFVAVGPDLFTGDLAPLMTPENIQKGRAFLQSLGPEDFRDPSRMARRLQEQPPASRPAAEALFRVLQPETRRGFAQDLAAAMDALRTDPAVDPARTGAVGFCMGGTLVGLLATLDPKLTAGVIFYGENPPDHDLPKIRARLLGLYGGEDHRITDTVPAFAQRMVELGRPFEYHVYPGAQHAFFNDSRAPTYHAEAARDAWPRTLSFLREAFR